MEAELWQKIQEDLLNMILARLPMRVIGKMRTVCKQWNYLLSSRDALQRIVPNWSLHSTPGFLIQFQWDWKDDVEYWAIEGSGSDIYRVPLLNHIVVNTCKSIFCCHIKGDRLDLSIGTPGTRTWRQLPRPPTSGSLFTGMAFDSSTRHCTLLLGNYYIDRRGQQGPRDNIIIAMSIYDLESNAWTAVSMVVPYNIRPCGKGIYCHGKFHWAAHTPNRQNLIVAFSIADGLWTAIPVPEGCRKIFPENLGQHDGQVVLVEQKEADCVRMWKLNEAE